MNTKSTFITTAAMLVIASALAISLGAAGAAQPVQAVKQQYCYEGHVTKHTDIGSVDDVVTYYSYYHCYDSRKDCENGRAADLAYDDTDPNMRLSAGPCSKR